MNDHDLGPRPVISGVAASLLQAIDGFRPPMRSVPTRLESSDLRLLMAVRGWTSPRDLLPSNIAPDARARILGALAPDCEKLDDASGTSNWLLSDQARRAELSRHSSAEILAALDRVPVSDATGQALRYAFTGLPPLATLSIRELEALAQVEPSVVDLAPHAPDPAGLRRALAIRGQLEEFDEFLRYGLFGRSRTLGELLDFCRAPRALPFFVSVYSIFGTGGIGKSSLMAALCRDLLTDASGPLVVYLDLDRGDLVPDESVLLSVEALRQIGCQEPAADWPLKMVRDQLRLALLDRVQSEGFSEAAPRDARSILSGCLAEISVRRTLVVVIDTFEHAEQSGPTGLKALLRWVAELGTVAGASDLRLVTAGRDDPDAAQILAALRPHVPLQSKELLDLDSRDACALLVARGVPTALADRLQPAFGGNPLVLGIAADLLTRVGDADGVEALAQGVLAGKIPPAVVQGVLYDRFLKHVVDEEARIFAHPGLILPEVTIILIQRVLAPLKGRRNMAAKEAKRIFEALAKASWLVRREGDKLIQRADVRRLLLQMMCADADRGGVVARVRRAALVHHLARSSVEDRAAAAYHLLMEVRAKEDLEVVLNLDLRGTKRFLNRHVEDLPALARTFVRAVDLDAGTSGGGSSSRRIPVEMAIHDLPDALWESYMAGLDGRGGEGDRLVARGDPNVALGYWNERPFGRRDAPPTFVLAALAETGSWSNPKLDLELILDELKQTSRSTGGRSGDARRVYWFARLVLLTPRWQGRLWQDETLGALIADAIRNHAPNSRHEIVALAAVFEGITEGRVTVLADRPTRKKNAAAGSARMHLQRATWKSAVTEFRSSMSELVVIQDDFAARMSSLAGQAVLRAGESSRFSASTNDTPAILATVQEGIDFYRSRPMHEFAGAGKTFKHIVTVRTGSDTAGARDIQAMLLRGQTPELHRPARQALLEGFGDDRDRLAAFARRAGALFSIRPHELEPKAFVSECLADPASFLLAFVQAADRARVLGAVLEHATSTARDARKLDLVRAALRRWDIALAGSIPVDWSSAAAR